MNKKKIYTPLPNFLSQSKTLKVQQHPFGPPLKIQLHLLPKGFWSPQFGPPTMVAREPDFKDRRLLPSALNTVSGYAHKFSKRGLYRAVAS